MQIVSQKIAPCLWFDTQVEEAAKFYVSIFKDSKITTIARYPDEGREIHGKEAGSVMTVAFELAGQSFVALNGGPHSSSTRRSRSRFTATAKPRWIISGASCRQAAFKARAAGSRTDSACPGR